jgi:prevent-host-death family protein
MPIQSIGAFDAKAKLSSLLRLVEIGQEFEITVRGRPVARLAPIDSKSKQRSLAISKMQNFMQNQVNANAGAGVDLRALIDEGRA